MQEIDNWMLKKKEKAIEYLIANGFSFNSLKNFYWKRLKFKRNEIHLRIVLSQKFPLEYPKFYVDQEDWFLTYPHIEKHKEYGFNICYIESEDKVAIFDGIELIKRELEKIYHVIKGYEKDTFNKKDFLEEYNGLNYLDS